MTATTMRIGSLFSGAGGLEMGVQAVLGGEVAWHAEVEPAACRVLAHRWPGVPNLGDVTRVDWASVEPVDVLCGGSPCQDVSHAGARRGMRAGTRSGLWSAMVDAIDVLRPRLVVWENVRGVLSAEADSAVEPCAGCVGDGDDGAVLRALGRVLGDLVGVGYDARWCGLRAADVGAPHGRFRVFVVAYDARYGGGGSSWDRHDQAWAADAAFGSGGGVAADASSGPLARPAAAGDGLRLAAERRHRPAADADVPGREGAESAGRLDVPARGATADADRYAVRLEPVTESGCSGPAVARHAVQRPVAADSEGGIGAGIATRDGGDPTLVRSEFGAGDRDSAGHPAARVRDVGRDSGVAWGPYEPAVRRWERVLGRPAPAPTERGPKGGQRLSPRFVEWMMGWPAGWVTDVPGVGRNDALRICGNGVVPQQVAAALRVLLDARDAAA